MLVITLGDPWSVTTELLAPLVAGQLAPRAPVVLVGSAWHWTNQLSRLGITTPPCETVTAWNQATRPGCYFFDTGVAVQRPAELLSPAERGAVAIAALNQLKQLPHTPRLAVVTAPIDKAACHAAGYALGGQTEFFEQLWQAQAVMTLAGPRLRVGLVTNHLPIAAVPAALTSALVAAKIALFATTLTQVFGIARPRIAVCGLNPHAGDHGLFGKEDADVIAPAVARSAGRVTADVNGPLPADTAFYRGYHGVYDGVLAMYHDQGLGPLKTVHFDDAVNVSGGLPHLRVSPDHGPARDLFMRQGEQRASPASWQASLSLAARYLAGG